MKTKGLWGFAMLGVATFGGLAYAATANPLAGGGDPDDDLTLKLSVNKSPVCVGDPYVALIAELSESPEGSVTVRFYRDKDSQTSFDSDSTSGRFASVNVLYTSPGEYEPKATASDYGSDTTNVTVVGIDRVQWMYDGEETSGDAYIGFGDEVDLKAIPTPEGSSLSECPIQWTLVDGPGVSEPEPLGSGETYTFDEDDYTDPGEYTVEAAIVHGSNKYTVRTIDVQVIIPNVQIVPSVDISGNTDEWDRGEVPHLPLNGNLPSQMSGGLSDGSIRVAILGSIPEIPVELDFEISMTIINNPEGEVAASIVGADSLDLSFDSNTTKAFSDSSVVIEGSSRSLNHDDPFEIVAFADNPSTSEPLELASIERLVYEFAAFGLPEGRGNGDTAGPNNVGSKNQGQGRVWARTDHNDTQPHDGGVRYVAARYDEVDFFIGTIPSGLYSGRVSVDGEIETEFEDGNQVQPQNWGVRVYKDKWDIPDIDINIGLALKVLDLGAGTTLEFDEVSAGTKVALFMGYKMPGEDDWGGIGQQELELSTDQIQSGDLDATRSLSQLGYSISST